MTYTVTLIPGDGIGPDVTTAAVRVLEATGVQFKWDERLAGIPALEAHGELLPQETLDSIRRNKLALKGPLTTPIGTGFRSVNVALRKVLDLYACLRPCKWYPGMRAPYQNVDLVVVRENTEDLYAGIEFEKGAPELRAISDIVERSGQGRIRDDAGLSLKVMSEFGSERIVRFAFDYARENGRRKVTAVCKANIMKFTDGLFYDVARGVAKKYPDIEYEEVLVDAMCMQLVRQPQMYDVLVLPNLYGDILSDLCAGLVGGLGVAPGANIGVDAILCEPIHGSAPRYTGQNKVNPIATMLSGVLLLRYLNEKQAADRLEGAIAAVVAEGKSVTYDMKPHRDDPTAVGTSHVADAVIEKMMVGVG
ncbi:MAG TPA: isocitrate/isopropylmalate dehydrogenase family protein [Dehalococcoidia bacterium]|nr:isocitrate/isopropylmalate dehydrogenase family protein [Dehalococcoidia bacterium]